MNTIKSPACPTRNRHTPSSATATLGLGLLLASLLASAPVAAQQPRLDPPGLALAQAGARGARAPQAPASSASAALERARRSLNGALMEVRQLQRLAPPPPPAERGHCALYDRPDTPFLHRRGPNPVRRRLPVRAVLSLAAQAMEWQWSHALPTGMLDWIIDLGPAPWPNTAAGLLCALDAAAAGSMEFHFNVRQARLRALPAQPQAPEGPQL